MGATLPLLATNRKGTSKQRGRKGHPSWETRIPIKKKKNRQKENESVPPCDSAAFTFVNLYCFRKTSQGPPSFRKAMVSVS